MNVTDHTPISADDLADAATSALTDFAFRCPTPGDDAAAMRAVIRSQLRGVRPGDVIADLPANDGTRVLVTALEAALCAQRGVDPHPAPDPYDARNLPAGDRHADSLRRKFQVRRRLVDGQQLGECLTASAVRYCPKDPGTLYEGLQRSP